MTYERPNIYIYTSGVLKQWACLVKTTVLLLHNAIYFSLIHAKQYNSSWPLILANKYQITFLPE